MFFSLYLQQYGKYLEMDLIDYNAINQKRDKIFFGHGRGLNLGPSSLESSALPSEPSHLGKEQFIEPK